jgi:hypothetical protein
MLEVFIIAVQPFWREEKQFGAYILLNRRTGSFLSMLIFYLYLTDPLSRFAKPMNRTLRSDKTVCRTPILAQTG